MPSYPPLETRELPQPPPIRQALGVGLVVLGLAVGTGELIVWPHLVVKHGLSLLWLALLGIGFQAVLSYEVARHQIATGEGFFTSSARVLKCSLFFWLFAAIIIYIWPGWAAAIGTLLRALFGFGDRYVWSLLTFGLVLALTFSGKAAYGLLERSLKILVPVFCVLLIAISFINLSVSDIISAIKGTLSFGNIPSGVDPNILFTAIVYAGAGGMMPLVVSLWYRDKQMGMGAHAGRITNPITGKDEAVAATGHKFDANDPENQRRWRGWMRFVAIDQGVIFFGLGFLTLFLLSVNAYAVLKPRGLIPEGLDVAVMQAEIFSTVWGALGGKLFLAMACLMLFAVMWTIIDALTRIVADIVHTNAKVGPYTGVFGYFARFSLSKTYYGLIVLVVAAGVLLLRFEQPLSLLVISGVLAGLTMAIYSPLLIYLNNTQLPKPLRPSLLINVLMGFISLFYLYFSIRTLIALFT